MQHIWHEGTQVEQHHVQGMHAVLPMGCHRWKELGIGVLVANSVVIGSQLRYMYHSGL